MLKIVVQVIKQVTFPWIFCGINIKKCFNLFQPENSGIFMNE